MQKVFSMTDTPLTHEEWEEGPDHHINWVALVIGLIVFAVFVLVMEFGKRVFGWK